MTLRCAHCKVKFEGRADRLYCSDLCRGRAATKRARKRRPRKPAGPKYSYRVVWMRTNFVVPARRTYARLDSAQRRFAQEFNRPDLTWITIERRVVKPWTVVSRWRGPT